MNRRNWVAVGMAIGMGISSPVFLGARQDKSASPHQVARKIKSSPFSDEPFTADMTIRGKLRTYHGKMYAGPDALRTDVQLSSGVAASVIVRYDKEIEWILMPGRHYVEAPIAEGNDLLRVLRDKRTRVKEIDLGPEKVGAYPCEKYRIEATDRGRHHSGWIWVAREKSMDGFIVKAQDQVSGESVELSNIRLAPPEPSLFDLPAGYHELLKPAKPRKPAH